MSKAPNYERPCRSGRHTIPANVMGCPECGRERYANRPPADRPAGGTAHKGVPVERLARYFGTIPPAEVLDGAVCEPEFAYLFDPVEKQGRPTTADRARLDAARAVCAGCPVQAACLAYAIENQRYGVWGGTYLFPKYYEKLRKRDVA
jgi:hypothetical protein